jgi:mono/diheme cytochrome c family protein
MDSTNTDETGLNSAGAVIYENYCASCHKSDGKGLPDLAPSLVGSQQVLGENEPLIKLLMTGKQGPIGVNDVKYDQGMPAFSFLGDMEIAAVLSYIRTQYGQNTSIISATEVAKERAKNHTN